MNNINNLFSNHGLMTGRMISGSKSVYIQKHPDHKVIFNANIIIESTGKIWYGDLDINLDFDKLSDIAKQLNEPIYILSEMDGRFENEKKPASDLIKKAKVIINPN